MRSSWVRVEPNPMSGVLLSGEIWTEIHRGKMDVCRQTLKGANSFWKGQWLLPDGWVGKAEPVSKKKKRKKRQTKKESISKTGVQGKHSGIEDTCLAAEGSWKGLRIGSPDKMQDAQLNVNFRYGMNNF